MKLASALILFAALFPAAALAADVLLYTGTGATSGDVSAIEAQLSALGLTYSVASASRINSMTRAQFDAYKLIVWPGGDSIVMGNALARSATSNIHGAVIYDGVSYIGFCAGAFMAETSSIYNTFGLAGTYFGFYSQGAIETVALSFPTASDLDVVYWDGPQLSGFGKVVARYPNGESAIAEDFVGSRSGLVILSGVHPEAPLGWSVPGYTASEVVPDNTYARTLISAAIRKSELSFY